MAITKSFMLPLLRILATHLCQEGENICNSFNKKL